ncbi:MAG: alanine racemase [Legionellaceae bacterium]|nr:alanine racemase [Legionellaceae bacterium]
MSRPTCLYVDTDALVHNFKLVKSRSKSSKLIAMVKANAYGCGIDVVVPALLPYADAFGVACLEEAMAIRKISPDCKCVLFQGVFDTAELILAYENGLEIVLHQPKQLEWLLANPAAEKIKVWVKINTGMHRLGFADEDLTAVVSALNACSWVDEEINMLTHLACADYPNDERNNSQIEKFSYLSASYASMPKSIANSAAIFSLPKAHADYNRSGIALYGVSPFSEQIGTDLGLKPVMSFVSEISAIHEYKANSEVGYSGTWQSDKPSVIAVVPAGYGDGYPRYIKKNTKVWVLGYEVPIVGRVSMDMLTIDITNCNNIKLGDTVELWGNHMPIEKVALAAETIGYELLCRISNRVIRKNEVMK